MLVAKGAAWDVANHYKGGHENCVLDTIGLYAAWDSQNLYVAWQMVNTTDTWQREGDASLSDGGRVLDVPLILALSVDPSSTSMTNKIAGGNNIWDMKAGVEFTSHVDHLFYMSGKPGLGEPAMFTAVDESGNTNYSTGCKNFSAAGISYDMAEGNISDSIWGLNFSENPSDVTDSAADWVDYKTFKGQMGTHNTKYDSFYEIKIPFTALGVDANYLANNGIGAMLVATRGESGIDCIPFDTTMLDNALDSYGSDPSTSHEKDDVDNITTSFARIGKLGEGGTIAPPPIATQPTTADPVVTQPTTADKPIATEPSEVTTAVAPTEGSDPIVIPPVVEPSETTPTEAPSTTASVQVPTLDFDDTTPTTENPTTVNTTPSNPVIVPTTGILGDADEDGKVSIKDATLIQKHVAKITTLSENAQTLADVDGNDVLNIRDVTFIQKFLAKLEVEFEIGKPVQGEDIIVPVPTTTAAAITTTAPVVAPPVITTAPATTAEPTEPTIAEPATTPTTAATEPQYTEPQYTEPQYTEPQYTEPDTPDYGTITLYFENTYGWSSVYWHAWNDAGGTNTPWPGDPMTQVSGNIYSAQVSSEYTGIIFNDGSGSDSAKTENQTIPGDGQMLSNGSWIPYDPNNNGGGNDTPIPPVGDGRRVYFSNNKFWSTVNAYTWPTGGEGTWPGVAMTLAGQNEHGEDVYYFDVPAGHDNIIFNDGNAQTVDISLTQYAQNGFYISGEDSGKFTVEQYDYVG